MPADPITAIAGAGLGLISGIGSLLNAGKTNRQLEDLLKRDPSYSISPIAQQRLSYAQTLLNAKMPGATAAEQGIYGAGANQNAAIDRNAVDPSTALAMKAATQGQQNNGFIQEGQQENQNFYHNLNYLTGAQEGMINENDKVFQDKVRRIQDEANIRGAQAQNRQAGWGMIAGLGGGLMNFGLSGGFKSAFPSSGSSGGSSGSAYVPRVIGTNPDGSPHFG